MKAECPKCGESVPLSHWPEAGERVTCHTCGTEFDVGTRLKFDFGQIHVTEEEATFVVEWQVR